MKKIRGFTIYFLTLIFLCITSSDFAQIRYADSVIAYSSEYSSGSYSVQQILGAPDAYPSYGDFYYAWASLTSDGQREFVELYYNNPAPVSS